MKLSTILFYSSWSLAPLFRCKINGFILFTKDLGRFLNLAIRLSVSFQNKVSLCIFSLQPSFFYRKSIIRSSFTVARGAGNVRMSQGTHEPLTAFVTSYFIVFTAIERRIGESLHTLCTVTSGTFVPCRTISVTLSVDAVCIVTYAV